MTSTFTVPPAALHDPDNSSPHHPYQSNQQRPSASSIDSTHLSPVLSRDSLSPSLNLETPAGSEALSHYQSSDFSDLDEDPFFGADFNNIDGGTPSFLDDNTIGLHQTSFSPVPSPDTGLLQYGDAGLYPLTPEQTASIHTTSPRSDMRGVINRSISEQISQSISPHELQKPFKPTPIVTQTTQFTPSQSSSCRSSEDGLAPSAVAMSCQSPRVTVSMWGKDSNAPIHTHERTFEDTPTTVRGGYQLAGDLMSDNDPGSPSISRDSIGRWQRDPNTGHAGYDPDQRRPEEVTSINEMASNRDKTERNQVVDHWLSEKLDNLSVGPQEMPAETIKALDQPRDHGDDGIPLGNGTENRRLPGQTYYEGPGGEMSQEDYSIIAMNHKWADAPMVRRIREDSVRHQPQTSQAAIEKFERMYGDTESILSRAATWGTRRRSFSSIVDFEVTGGNFLKKLSISRGDKANNNKPGGLLKDLRGLVRRPSAAQLLKRTRSNAHEEESQPRSDSRGSQDRGSQDSKRESLSHLPLQPRMPNWGKKPTPSLNTALVSMGHNFASIGTTHSRSGSISATPITSPKSPFGGLTVKGSLRRPRSKSDLPKASPINTNNESHPTLVSMWKQTGGPPVASLAKTTAADLDDEDEDDEDNEESDLDANANLIDGITPNFSGFHQHVLTLNPQLAAAQCSYLVDRIAHQQIIRYKQLLSAKVKHLGLGANCSSGALCVALGGTAAIMDPSGEARDLDPLSTKFPDEEDGSPTEGAITNESFPQDIPMPPTHRLPAEFECQLCYQCKPFKKPSDWTKHVHEDVQPFTCTWDKCRDPKIFKRKADWVRHENEGHRHLEWWTCDVDDCRHTCYRRDNFLQHLVREHKFLEPKVKTKAAMKKAGGMDPTWQKVEQCHQETTTRPQEEPCKFCSKIFPTWKKLTVHLAKHMEQISLPVLRLVAAKAKELDADTIISPVQDPPPRQMIPPPSNQTSPVLQYPMGPHPHPRLSPHAQHLPYQQPGQGQLMYPVLPEQFPQTSFFPVQYDSIGHNLQTPHMGMHHVNQGYEQNRQMNHNIPVTTAPYVQAPNHYMPLQSNGMDQFTSMNGLGLQNHSVSMGGQMGGQMGFEGMVDPSSGNGSPFSGHGSISPYNHSPNLNAGNRDTVWDDKQMNGYLQ